eukprot:gene16662-biopygen326
MRRLGEGRARGSANGTDTGWAVGAVMSRCCTREAALHRHYTIRTEGLRKRCVRRSRCVLTPAAIRKGMGARGDGSYGDATGADTNIRTPCDCKLGPRRLRFDMRNHRQK